MELALFLIGLFTALVVVWTLLIYIPSMIIKKRRKSNNVWQKHEAL